MAASPTVSDSEKEEKSKSTAEEEEEEGEEEVYEIEQILDAKRGQFAGVRTFRTGQKQDAF